MQCQLLHYQIIFSTFASPRLFLDFEMLLHCINIAAVWVWKLLDWQTPHIFKFASVTYVIIKVLSFFHFSAKLWVFNNSNRGSKRNEAYYVFCLCMYLYKGAYLWVWISGLLCLSQPTQSVFQKTKTNFILVTLSISCFWNGVIQHLVELQSLSWGVMISSSSSVRGGTQHRPTWCIPYVTAIANMITVFCSS